MTKFKNPTVLCDRCGTYHELGGEGPTPEGWQTVRNKDLCAECATEWNQFWDRFLNSYRTQAA